jgi:hypothetical protein
MFTTKDQATDAATKAHSGNFSASAMAMVSALAQKTESIKAEGALKRAATKKALTDAAQPPTKKSKLGKPDWKFPGVPKTNMPAKEWGDMKVYTSVGAKCWRCLRKGSTQEKRFSWKDDAKESWAELKNYLADNC